MIEKAKKIISKHRIIILIAILAFSYITFMSFSKYILREEETHIQNAENFYFTIFPFFIMVFIYFLQITS